MINPSHLLGGVFFYGINKRLTTEKLAKFEFETNFD